MKKLNRCCLYWCWLQECLCSCEDILSLHHNKDDQEEEEGYKEEDGFDEGLTSEEDLRRMATLKSLTGAVMSLIECGNRAMVTRSPKSRRLDSAPATTTNKNNNLLNNNTNFSRKNNESIVKSDKMEKEEVEESSRPNVTFIHKIFEFRIFYCNIASALLAFYWQYHQFLIDFN